jgi:adenine-specific DNA-methyltransferase
VPDATANAERASVLADAARWRDTVGELTRTAGKPHLVDAAIYLAWSSARGSGDIASAQRAPHTAEAILTTFERARARYDSALFELSSRLDSAACSVVSEIWSDLATARWAAVPVEVFGDLYEQRSEGALRKMAGAYYTPHRVVHYLVDVTLAAAIARADPSELGDLRILDPACGCGAILVGAYRKLLEAYAASLHTTPADVPLALRLSIAARHLHGLDLDAQAIAIAQLSLRFEATYGDNASLTALERAAAPGEPQSADASAPAWQSPRLICGNALVGTDFKAGASTREVNPLDVTAAFSDVFARGGFDLVLGNPPYVSYGGRHAVPVAPRLRAYYAERYRCGGWSSAHSLFMERAVSEFAKGTVALIVPDQVGHLAGYRSLRALLLEHAHLREVRYWGEDVFAGVTTPSLTFVLEKPARSAATTIIEVDGTRSHASISGSSAWTQARASHLGILAKLHRRTLSLRPWLADCGVRTTDARAQVVPLAEATDGDLPVLEGKLVARYRCEPPRLAVRMRGKSLPHVRKPEQYERAGFLIRQTANYPIVGPRRHATFFRNSLHALRAPHADTALDVRYLVALLNSKVLRFAYLSTVREAGQRVFPQVKLGALGVLPILAVDFDREHDRHVHDTLVACVTAMLDLQVTQQTDPSPAGAMRIAALDERIDQLVYQAYELDPPEIAAIEQLVTALPARP